MIRVVQLFGALPWAHQAEPSCKKSKQNVHTSACNVAAPGEGKTGPDSTTQPLLRVCPALPQSAGTCPRGSAPSSQCSMLPRLSRRCCKQASANITDQTSQRERAPLALLPLCPIPFYLPNFSIHSPPSSHPITIHRACMHACIHLRELTCALRPEFHSSPFCKQRSGPTGPGCAAWQ